MRPLTITISWPPFTSERRVRMSGSGYMSKPRAISVSWETLQSEIGQLKLKVRYGLFSSGSDSDLERQSAGRDRYAHP